MFKKINSTFSTYPLLFNSRTRSQFTFIQRSLLFLGIEIIERPKVSRNTNYLQSFRQIDLVSFILD